LGYYRWLRGQLVAQAIAFMVGTLDDITSRLSRMGLANGDSRSMKQTLLKEATRRRPKGY